MHGPALTAEEVASQMRDRQDADIQAFITSTTNHTPSEDCITQVELFRNAVQQLAADFIRTVPSSRARSVALTHLEDAVMWGVKALILAGRES